MTRLVLRRGTVVQAPPPAGPEQRLVVDVPGRGPRGAIGDVAIVGAASVDDDVVVNTQAADLASARAASTSCTSTSPAGSTARASPARTS